MKGVAYLLLVILNILMTSLTLAVMWQWFIMPLGLPAIGLAHAFGLSTIVSMFTLRSNKFVKGVLVERSVAEVVIDNFTACAAVLGVGYVTTLFM